MRKFLPLRALLCTVFLSCLACAAPLWAVDQGERAVAASAADQEQAFRQSIHSLESSNGAYASGLSEQLLSLGLALQSQGRHREAVALFKRGVHLTRVNEGLYSEEQIPLLQGEISSHLALGQYSNADERQRYLYRVQVRSMESGTPRAIAFMQQANWQYNAYQLGLGGMGYSRLMNMWDLYRLALNDLVAREGEDSHQLIPPLRGMLQAQYLIAGYDPQSESTSDSADDLGARQELNRFYAYRAQSYEKGSAVIKAIHDIETANSGPQSIPVARALVMLGDWQLWNEERSQSMETYRLAMMELAQRDDAQVQIDLLLGQPAALPDLDGVRPLPAPVSADEADILLEFGVSPKGRVTGLERIDENDEAPRGKANRLMRKLRKTRFRPRFEAGEPVGTERIVKAFQFK